MGVCESKKDGEQIGQLCSQFKNCLLFAWILLEPERQLKSACGGFYSDCAKLVNLCTRLSPFTFIGQGISAEVLSAASNKYPTIWGVQPGKLMEKSSAISQGALWQPDPFVLISKCLTMQKPLLCDKRNNIPLLVCVPTSHWKYEIIYLHFPPRLIFYIIPSPVGLLCACVCVLWMQRCIVCGTDSYKLLIEWSKR